MKKEFMLQTEGYRPQPNDLTGQALYRSFERAPEMPSKIHDKSYVNKQREEGADTQEAER